jgi:hypothetical protein
MLDCVACLHQVGSRLHEEWRLAPPGSEGAPACAPSRVRPPGQPRRRRRRSRGALPVGGGWGAHARTAAARRSRKGDGATPRPCSSCRCKSRSTTPSCPSLPTGQCAPLSRAELRSGAQRRSPLEPGADVTPPLEQKPEMVRTARVHRHRRRDRRWSGASRACRRGGACLLRRWGEIHERSREGK